MKPNLKGIDTHQTVLLISRSPTHKTDKSSRVQLDPGTSQCVSFFKNCTGTAPNFSSGEWKPLGFLLTTNALQAMYIRIVTFRVHCEMKTFTKEGINTEYPKSKQLFEFDELTSGK